MILFFNELETNETYSALRKYSEFITIHSEILSIDKFNEMKLIYDSNETKREIIKKIYDLFDKQESNVIKEIIRILKPLLKVWFGIENKTDFKVEYINTNGKTIPIAERFDNDLNLIYQTNIKEENSIQMLSKYVLIRLCNDKILPTNYILTKLNEENIEVARPLDEIPFHNLQIELFTLLFAYRKLIIEKEQLFTFKWLNPDKSSLKLLFDFLIENSYIDYDINNKEATFKYFREVFSIKPITKSLTKIKLLRNKKRSIAYLIYKLQESNFIAETKIWKISSECFIDYQDKPITFSSNDLKKDFPDEKINSIISTLKKS